MGINVEVTSVDKDNGNITFTQDDESRTLPVILPAQIQWAREGKAEIGVNQEAKINFIRSLEPKPISTVNKPKPMTRAISTLKVLEGVTPSEAAVVYDNINATNNTKCGASTPFMRADGKYDVWFYVTTFVPIGSDLDIAADIVSF